jgi:hypothetical protein
MFRQNETKEKSDTQKPTYLSHILGPLTGALGSHIPRVWLNRAVYHTQFFGVLKDTKQYWHSGLSLNVARCYASVLTQSSVRATSQYYCGSDNSASSKAAALFAPALASTFVAVTIETPFIRKSTQQKPSHLPSPIAFTKCNIPLTAFYFCRELGFSNYLFGQKDLINTLAITGYTAICHKGIIWEATNDMLQPDKMGTTPHFSRDGFGYTVKALAKGNTYTHPTCRVPIKNPVNTLQLMVNLLSVSCGKNLFLFRFIHLNVLSMTFEFGNQTLAPRLANSFPFWQKKSAAAVTTQIDTDKLQPHNNYRK